MIAKGDMRQLGMIFIMILCFLKLGWSADIRQPEEGLTFQEIRTINQEIRQLYHGVLKEDFRNYLRHTLRFTTNACQVRYPKIGCLTFQRKQGVISVQVDFVAGKTILLKGFNRLILKQDAERKRSIELYDSRNKMIYFPFSKTDVELPVLPLGKTTIHYDKIKKLVIETNELYQATLKDVMRHYRHEQWMYPLKACDSRFLDLGCVSYRKDLDIWLISIEFEEQTRKDFSGFHQLIFRKRADGLGEIELNTSDGQEVFFHIVNERLEDAFVPMPEE